METSVDEGERAKIQILVFNSLAWICFEFMESEKLVQAYKGHTLARYLWPCSDSDSQWSS